MKFLVSSLLAVVLLAVNTPVARAQSDILASATRLASTVELEQEEGTVFRRMRSRMWTIVGLVGLVGGVAYATRPPKCGYTGMPPGGAGSVPDGGYFFQYNHSEEFRGKKCDVAVDIKLNPDLDHRVFFGLLDQVYTNSAGELTALKSYAAGYGNRREVSSDGFFFFGKGEIREYYNDVVVEKRRFVATAHAFEGIEITQGRDPWKVGALVAGVGAAVMWRLGLRRVDVTSRESVDVPFRVGVTPDGGVLATRSIKW